MINLNNIRVFNPLKNNTKRQQLDKERKESIRYQNLSLLKKIEQISLRKSSYRHPFSKQSLNYSLRMQNCRKINRQNQQLAVRLQSQQSNYSQSLYKSIDRKRSNTSMSATKKRTSTSVQFRPSSNHKTSMDDEMITQNEDGYKSRNTICNESVQVDGKLFWIEFSKSADIYFVTMQGYSMGKRYKLRLTGKVGEYLSLLIDNNKFNFAHRISYVGDSYTLRVPLRGFSRIYTFWELKQPQSRKASLVLKKSTGKLQRQLLYSIQSGTLGIGPYKATQQTKQITNLQPMSSQQILSESSHSYMYQNRTDEL